LKISSIGCEPNDLQPEVLDGPDILALANLCGVTLPTGTLPVKERKRIAEGAGHGGRIHSKTKQKGTYQKILKRSYFVVIVIDPKTGYKTIITTFFYISTSTVVNDNIHT
jgi:hypothetical protein